MTHLVYLTPNEFKVFDNDELSFVFVKADRPFRIDDEVVLELKDDVKQIKGIITNIWTDKETSSLKKGHLCLAVKIKKGEPN